LPPPRPKCATVSAKCARQVWLAGMASRQCRGRPRSRSLPAGKSQLPGEMHQSLGLHGAPVAGLARTPRFVGADRAAPRPRRHARLYRHFMGRNATRRAGRTDSHSAARAGSRRRAIAAQHCSGACTSRASPKDRRNNSATSTINGSKGPAAIACAFRPTFRSGSSGPWASTTARRWATS
jgi:hypothetical protein